LPPSPARAADGRDTATALAAEPAESNGDASGRAREAVGHRDHGHANGSGGGNGNANGSGGGNGGSAITMSLGATKVSFQTQADEPSSADCGSIMVRNGSCYKCLNCGSTSGCS
jgi:hypothetical protein